MLIKLSRLFPSSEKGNEEKEFTKFEEMLFNLSSPVLLAIKKVNSSNADAMIEIEGRFVESFELNIKPRKMLLSIRD